MKELVSVVVPTYKRPQGLKSALKSVLAQTYHELEILVVNDNSEEDGIHHIIKEIDDSRIHYYENQRTKGANGARNTGILSSKGNLIAFLDDDDEWLSQKLEWQLSYLNHHPDFIGVFSAFKIHESGRWKQHKQPVSTLTMRDCLLNTVSIGSSSSLLIQRKVFDQVGLWDESLIRQQDKELLVRILASGTIGHDPRISLVVNGHNDPHPLKSIPGHQVYFSKVQPYLNYLNEADKSKFHSFHFRRLCMYYLRLGDHRKALALYRSALKFQKFHLRKDAKNLLYFMRSVFTTKPSF